MPHQFLIAKRGGALVVVVVQEEELLRERVLTFEREAATAEAERKAVSGD